MLWEKINLGRWDWESVCCSKYSGLEEKMLDQVPSRRECVSSADTWVREIQAEDVAMHSTD